MARDQNLDVEFFPGHVMDLDKLGMFDYVVCLDAAHRVVDPIQTIHTLIGNTRQKLVLGLPDIDLNGAYMNKSRPGRALLGGWRPLLKLLPHGFRPGILVVDSNGRFLMTRKWIGNLLRAQRRDIARIEIVDSEQSHRYLVLASMRRLSALSVISGPAGVGKSAVIGKLKSGDVEVCRLLDFEQGDGWQSMIAMELDEGAEVVTDRLLLEYSIGKPVVRALNYEDHPALTIMRVAETKRVYVLVCPPDIVIARLLGMHGGTRPRPGGKAERLIHEYSRPGGFQKLYEKWISYCKANRWEITYVDVSSRQVKPVPEGEALQLIIHDPQRAYHHS